LVEPDAEIAKAIDDVHHELRFKSRAKARLVDLLKPREVSAENKNR
jgi:hypothetical protein